MITYNEVILRGVDQSDISLHQSATSFIHKYISDADIIVNKAVLRVLLNKYYSVITTVVLVQSVPTVKQTLFQTALRLSIT